VLIASLFLGLITSSGLAAVTKVIQTSLIGAAPEPALKGANGLSYSLLDGNIYFAEWDGTDVKSVNVVSKVITLVYSAPCGTGVAVDSLLKVPGPGFQGRDMFYLSCYNGAILKLYFDFGVWLTSPIVTLTASALPYQMQLYNQYLYVVDYYYGTVWQIDTVKLAAFAIVPEATFPNALGLVISSSGVAYISTEIGNGWGGGMFWLNLNTKVFGGLAMTTSNGYALSHPFFLTWQVADKSFFVTSRDNDWVYSLALSTPVSHATLLGGLTPWQPNMIVPSPVYKNVYFLSSHEQISQLVFCKSKTNCKLQPVHNSGRRLRDSEEEEYEVDT